MNLTVAVTGTTITSAVDDGGRFMLQNVPTGHVDLRFSGPNVDAHLGLDGIADHSSIAITVRLNGTTAQLDDDNRENPNNEVEVEGLVTSKSASTLTVNGRMIQITATTQIVHGDTTIPLSSIAVGDRVHVKGTASGSTASGTSIVTATKIEVQQQSTPPANGKDDGSNDDGNDNGDNQSGGNNTSAEVSGAVAGLSGTCPTLTFTVGSTTVKTSASTQFKGTTCGSLKSGVKVEVTGTRQSDKSILATSVQKD